MRSAVYSHVLLTASAVFLGILALERLVAETPVCAQSSGEFHLYVEPGTTLLRKPDGSAQMAGKVVIDLRTGNVWGFPTLAGVPYPVDKTTPVAPVAQPMYLGKFDFSRMRP